MPPEVCAALDHYREPGQSYADVLVDLLAELDRLYRQERRQQMRQLLRDAGLEFAVRDANRSTARLRR